MVFRKLLIVLLVLFFASEVIGADFGCGRDTDRNGSVDNLCPAETNDRDHDGFLNDVDCDDNDWSIFPGVPTTKGCSGGQWRMCKADGTGYTACTSDPYNPTVSDNRLYTDRTCTSVIYLSPSGNDSTGNGTFANPYQTLTKVSSGGPGAVTITDGTCIVLRGGTYNSTYNSGGTKVFYQTTPCDTNGCAIMAYPGETPKIVYTGSDEVGGMVYISNSNVNSKWTVDGIEFDGENTGKAKGIGFWDNGLGHRIRRNYVHNINGVNANNLSGIQCYQGTKCDITHNYVRDVCEQGHSSGCIAGNTGAIDCQLTGCKINYNIIDAWGGDSARMAFGIRWKHANNSEDPAYVIGNYVNNVNTGIGAHGRNVHVYGNLILPNNLNDTQYGVGINSGGTDPNHYFGPVFIKKNTIVGTSTGIHFRADRFRNTDGSVAANGCDGTYDSGINEVEGNIISIGTVIFNINNGIYTLNPYGPDATRSHFYPSKFSINNSCYWNAGGNTNNAFNDYGANNGTGEYCTERGPQGGQRTFDNWKSTYPTFDTNSFWKNPGLNSIYAPTDSDCLDKGYISYMMDVSVGDPEPTPTPTPTPPPSPPDEHCAIDTNRDGVVDSWCVDHADPDRDGYTVAQGDCDESDPFVWPGSPLDKYDCPEGQWKQCKSDGTGWSTCTSTGYLSEAVGSGRNLFIDPVNGNDETGNGTEGNPLKSFIKLGYHYYIPGNPAGWIGLIRGDVIYVKNGTVDPYNSNYSSSGTVAFATRNQAASGEQYIRIRNYPGHRPVMGGGMYVEGSQYFSFENFDTQNGNVVFVGGATESDRGKIINLRIKDVDGIQNNNLAGITLHSNENMLVQSTEIYDAYDRTNYAGLTENNSGLVMFRTKSATLRGVKVVNTVNQTSNCIKLKHQDTNSIGKVSLIDTATCWNTGIYSSTSYVFGMNGAINIKNSLALGHTLNTPFLAFRDLGGVGEFSDNSLIENNTCINCNMTALDPSSTYTTGFGNVTFKKNVIVDPSASGRFIAMLFYGSDGCYTNIVGGEKYKWENNCYHTPNKTFSAAMFEGTSGASGCAIAPTTTALGDTYSNFATWLASVHDSGSFNKNPLLTTSSLATDVDCADKGILAAQTSSGLDIGCGRDTDQDGLVDHWCPGTDKDFDGVSDDIDCDDNDWSIFPGIPTGKGCPSGQWRMCKADGTGYTACSSDTWNPTVGTNQLHTDRLYTNVIYVSPSGNDSTGNGTFANPYRTLGKVSTNGPGAVSITDGTAIVLRGGTYEDTYNDGGTTRFFYQTTACETNGCALVSYPGETPKIRHVHTSSSVPAINVSSSNANSKWTIQGIEVDGEGIGEGVGILMWDAGTGHRIRLNHIHNLDGENDNNLSGIKCYQNTQCVITHNRVMNICDSQHGSGCAAGNTGGIEVQNQNTDTSYNIVGTTGGNDTVMGYGIRYKHGNIGTGPSYFTGNYVFGVSNAMQPRGRNVHAIANLIYPNSKGFNYNGSCISTGPESNHPYFGPGFFKYNTCIGGITGISANPFRLGNADGSLAVDNCSGTYDPLVSDYKYNVFVTSNTANNIDNGMIRIDPYGSDILRSYFMPSKFDIDNNCYFNTNALTANAFREFSDNDANLTCSGRGSSGAAYDFAAWKAVFPAFDANSYYQDPVIDNIGAATHINCSDKGYIAYLLLGDTPEPPPPSSNYGGYIPWCHD